MTSHEQRTYVRKNFIYIYHMEFYVTLNPDVQPFNYTLKQSMDKLLQTYTYDSNNLTIVLCREVASREHFHLYFKDSVKTCSAGKAGDATRTALRRWVRGVFSGEVRFSSKQVESSIRAIAYTIKDGNYLCHNLDWGEFLKAKSVSHPKLPKYTDAMSQFYSSVSGKNVRQLISEVIDIHDTYNLMLDPQKVAKIVRLARIKQKDSSYRNELIERIFTEL